MRFYIHSNNRLYTSILRRKLNHYQFEEVQRIDIADWVFVYGIDIPAHISNVITSDEKDSSHPNYLPFPIQDKTLLSILDRIIGVVACDQASLPFVEQTVSFQAIFVVENQTVPKCSLWVSTPKDQHFEIEKEQVQVILLEHEEQIDQYISIPNTYIFLAPFLQPQNQQQLSKILNSSTDDAHILIVEDSSLMREKINNTIKSMNITTTTAKDGVDALIHLETCSPNLIITDYEMPNMNGWEFCRAIKKEGRFTNIPIIMLTARSTEQEIQKSRLLGISEYITKPFREDQLISVVRNLLSKQKAQIKANKLSIYAPSDALQSSSNKTQLKHIAILFSDIKSFTSMCEGVAPREIVLWLNRYLDAMSQVIVRNHGIIDKFIGDAIVARFDCSTPYESCLYATKASLEMLAAVDQLNKQFRPRINIRIGINWGEVILGNIGSEQHRLDYTMIGDAVNSTQRLEAAAKASTCLASKELIEQISDSIVTGEQQILHVKNRVQPLLAYPVLSIVES